MIASIDYILNNKKYIENMKGGENINIITKKCDIIKDKYGVPNGYYCNMNYSSYNKNLYEKNKNTEINNEYEEIDDNLYEKLIDFSNEIKKKNNIQTKKKLQKQTKKTKKNKN